jgi:glycosyltransferase 2 family protein
VALTRAKLIRYVVFGVLGALIVVTLLTTILSGFTDVKRQWFEIRMVFRHLNWWWVLAAGLANFGTFFFETFQLWFLGKALGKKTSYWRMWDIFFVGNFFSYALPTSSGGSVFQVYFLLDDGYKVSESSVLITVRGIISVLVRLLFVLMALSAIPLGLQLPTAAAVSWIVYISITVLILMVVLACLVIANPFIFVWMVNLLCKWTWLRKVSKINDVEAFRQKGLSFLAEIRNAGKMMLSGKKTALLMSALSSAVTWFLLKSMPYFILLAIGEKPSLLVVLLIGIISQLATAWFPTPGAVGAVEVGISTFFLSFFTLHHGRAEIAAAVGVFLLLYRLADYHMDVVFGAPIALTMIARKFGKKASTADLSTIDDEIRKKSLVEQTCQVSVCSDSSSIEAMD